VKRSLRETIIARAKSRCEYCQREQAATESVFEVEHIVSRKHHGLTEEDNLCLSCIACNQFKGSNIAGIDPKTGLLVRLFHPRQDTWAEHFKWDGDVLVGLTDVGRTTVDVLKINEQIRIDLRRFDRLTKGSR
jgi:hypothetical protein